MRLQPLLKKSFCFALFALMACHSAFAGMIRVSQESAAGAGDFDNNILGAIEVYSGSGTFADFYQYGSPVNSSYNGQLNGGPEAVADGVLNFFVNDASGNLGFFTVIDAPADPDGFIVKMKWELTGDKAQFGILDDGNATAIKYAYNSSTGLLESTLANLDDVFNYNTDAYTLEQSIDSTVFGTVNRGLFCCTDGYVIGHLNNDWSMIGSFWDQELSGIIGGGSWLGMSADGSQISLAVENGRRVRFDMGPLAPVPEPSAFFLLIFGLAGLRFKKTSFRNGLFRKYNFAELK